MHASKRGATLIELTIAFMITTILATGSFAALIFLMQGIDESQQDNDVQQRVDIVRELISSDVRPGERINFPATDGASGAYTEGADNGQYFDLDVKAYNTATDTYFTYRVRWESRRTGATGKFTINRRLWTGAAWSLSPFQVEEVDNFTLTRQSLNRIDFDLFATEPPETAQIDFTLSLRNVP